MCYKFVSPGKYIQGQGILDQLAEYSRGLGDRPFIIISKGIGRINDLGILETGSVIEGNEADVLTGAVGTDPALQLNEFVLVLFQICSFFGQFIQLANTYFCWHNNISPYF